MANQNAQPTSPAPQPALKATDANAPAQNILEDVCEIENKEVQSTSMIERPPIGETREVTLEQGRNYIFGFDKSAADSFVVENGTLTITFDCGGKLVLNNYVAATSGDDAATFAFSDVVPQGELSALIKVVDTTTEQEDPENTAKNEKTARSEGEDVANIEPAAGDEADAAALAQIEPAAGEAGAGGAGNSGYGFNTPYSSDPVGPLAAVGPLGATALNYGANFQQPNPLIGEEETPVSISSANELVDETFLGPIVETGKININYGEDGPGGIASNGNFTVNGSLLGGNLTSGGETVVITQTPTGYVGTTQPGGVTIFTLDIESPSGNYTFTLNGPLDHADPSDPNDVINIVFGFTASDSDGDTLSTSITVGIADDVPVLEGDGIKFINEDDIPGASVSGNLVEDFGSDGEGEILPNGNYTASGDFSTPNLQSNGHDVVVTQTANGYVGTANGVDVFNITINPTTGAYTFNLLQPLDHSVGGDTITLTFGAIITDYDGDSDPADIVIKIVDDVPEIKDDNPTIGNGLEVIDETDMNGGDITVNGNLPHDTGADTPATIAPNGNTQLGGSFTGPNLTSHGETVVITQTANGYVGTTTGGTPVFTFTIGNNGAYSFTLHQQIDHADGTNANDVINLRFGVTITDNDGDTDSGFVNVNIVDDAPVLTGDGIKTISEDDIPGASVSGNLVEDFGEDGQGNIHTTDDFAATGDLLGGNLTSNGHTVTVTSTANGYVGTANGAEVFTLTINPVTGAYTFNLIQPLDHSAGGNAILLTFGAEIVDYDGDTDPADIVIKVKDDQPEICDANPTIGNGLEVVDETLPNPDVRNGQINFDFGGDGPGSFGSSGTSSSSIALTSHGQPVTITPNANGYTGTAGGNTIFTMVINADGTYTFTLLGVLDHPVDGPTAADHNDIITLNFGVRVTDADGDSDTGNIIVRVHDDGPTAVNDGPFTSDGSNQLLGNVLTNDSFGQDGAGRVISVQFGGNTVNVPAVGSINIAGAHGTLTLSANGSFTYTPNGTDGVDEFRYTMNDYDGDTSSACLTIEAEKDYCPILVKPAVEIVDETFLGPIVETGVVQGDFFGDGPGTFSMDGNFSSSGSKLGGNLTSNGDTVNVTNTATGYTGTATDGRVVFTLTINPATGGYTFTLLDTLDHQDGANPNDVIRLTFGVRGTDTDGDFDSTIIRVDVLDDAPVAVNDGPFASDGVTVLNGNVLANDDFNNDGPGAVVAITFGATTIPVPAVGSVNIAGAHGTLTISANGNYTYTPNGTDGTDQFRYTMDDYDNDTASATLTIQADKDDCPILIKPAKEVVDETFLGPIVETGTVQGNFFGDGPGTFSMDGNFSSSGSKLNGNLTSLGHTVTVTNTATGYVGTANGQPVFTININQATGAYTFTLLGVLDHADGSNPNDVITLNFGVRGTDTDGDYDSTVIRVDVLDDAPIANDDHNTQTGVATGNVVTGLNGGPGAADDLSNDLNNNNSNTVTKISFGGTTVDVPAVGQAVINGAYGQLKISADGSYTYTPFGGGGGGTGDAKTFLSDGETYPDMNESQPLDPSEQLALGIKAENLDLNGGENIDVTFVSEQAGYSNTLGVFTVANDGTLQAGRILIPNSDGVAAGANYDFTAGAGADALGFFVIADGANVNGGYPGINFNVGEVKLVYDYGLPTERLAKITDDGSHVKVVYTNGGVDTVLNGPTYYTTERGGTDNLNPDGTTRVVSAIPGGDDEVLRIGFEDLPALGDKDYNDVVFDLRINEPDCGCHTDQFTYTLTDRDGDSDTAILDFVCTPDTNVDITVNNGADKICIKEDGQGIVPVNAVYTGGDGDEVLSLKVEGIQANWTVTAPGWTNQGGGVYTITLPAGQTNYSGNFTFKPPANSDIDMKNLVFTATVSDPDTGSSKTATDLFTVQVDAVVDTPILTVPGTIATQNWYYMNQGYQMPLNISSKVTDTDGSEMVTKIQIDLKQPLSHPVHPFYTLDDMGIGLNKGTEVSPGIWEITVNAADAATALDGLKLVVPNNMNYTNIHNSHIGGNESVNIVVKTFVKEKVKVGDGNGECDFTDNETCVIKSICLTFRITPLVLDLDGNGIDVVSAEAGIMFDMNNNGTLDKTSWVGAGDGLLAIDNNHDGVINNQAELFGNTTTVADGFANLAQYDSNGDGKIDAGDDVFADLIVWKDANQDGVSQADEQFSLNDLGITSISLNATETGTEVEDAYISHESTYTTADGQEHAISDVWFNVIEGNNLDDGATLEGTQGQDAIYGTANNDVLIGNAANDVLFGGEGEDIFVFGSFDGSVDTIADFEVGDILDVSGLVQGFDPVQDSINEFVFGTEVDGNTVISVDATGSGDAAHATVIAVLEGSTGLDLQQIIAANQTNV
jgi:T1SS-143 domain-containing protein